MDSDFYYHDFFRTEKIVPSPEISQLKGHQLTEKDIDKKVIRIAPFITKKSPFGFDNSYTPEKVNKIDIASTKFKGFIIEDGIKKLKLGEYSINPSIYPDYNDDKWLTVEEAKEQLGIKD